MRTAFWLIVIAVALIALCAEASPSASDWQHARASAAARGKDTASLKEVLMKQFKSGTSKPSQTAAAIVGSATTREMLRDLEARSDVQTCKKCPICSDIRGLCKNLDDSLCSVGSGVQSDLTTEIIVLVNITTRTGNYYDATVLRCFSVLNNGSCPATIRINLPVQNAGQTCRDADLNDPVNQGRVLAMYNYVNNTGIAGIPEANATHATCYFNKVVSDLTDFDKLALNFNNMSGTPDYIRACSPICFTEFGIGNMAGGRQFIEVYNPHPNRTVSVANWILRQKEPGGAILDDVFPNPYVMQPQDFVVFDTASGTSDIFVNHKYNIVNGSQFLLLTADPQNHFIDQVTFGSELYAAITQLPPGTKLSGVALYPNTNPLAFYTGPFYNSTQNDFASEYFVCGDATYGTSSCTPGKKNGNGPVGIGRRDATGSSISAHARVVCLRQAGTAAAADFCSGAQFAEARNRLIHDVSSVIPASFETVDYTPEFLASFTLERADMLVLGDPVIGELSPADLAALQEFVKAGGSVLANVNQAGPGAKAVTAVLLGRPNGYSSPTPSNCEQRADHRLEIVKSTGFVSRSERRLERFTTRCSHGIECAGGQALAVDPMFAKNGEPAAALCYSDAALGRVLLVTSWHAFGHGLHFADNAAVLSQFFSSALFF